MCLPWCGILLFKRPSLAGNVNFLLHFTRQSRAVYPYSSMPIKQYAEFSKCCAMPVEQVLFARSLQFAHPEHIPESPDQGPITLENVGDRLFLRCERQVSLPSPLLRLASSSSFSHLRISFALLLVFALFVLPFCACCRCSGSSPLCMNAYKLAFPWRLLVSCCCPLVSCSAFPACLLLGSAVPLLYPKLQSILRVCLSSC
jgi:hypothetical protein